MRRGGDGLPGRRPPVRAEGRAQGPKARTGSVVGAERFLAEIKTTANLQHPHILPLFDSGQADSFLFYVMPYVEGDPLRDKIDREKLLSVQGALRITERRTYSNPVP